MGHTLYHHFLIAFRALVVGLILMMVWAAVLLVGFFFWFEFPSPVNLLLGLPLILGGGSMVLVNFYEMVVGVISWRWGRTHCPFCSSPQKVEEILSSQNGFK